MAYAIIRTAKLKTNGSIGGSLDHNYRERETKNADENLTHLNEHSLESKQAAYDAIQERLPEKVRKDGVRCIEYLITASPDFFEKNDLITQEKYFEASKQWLENKHGAENVICTSIHKDETSPHLVAYVVPYAWNEKKQKETLNCKHYLGGRNKLSAMQTDFHKHVKHFGLNRGIERSDAKHQTIKQFYTKIQNPTMELSKCTPELNVPEPKLLESKDSYGKRVAEAVGNDVWNKACDNLENNILKVTHRDYITIEKENKKLKSQIAYQERKIEKQAEQIRTLEKANQVSLKIMRLKDASELLRNIDDKIKEQDNIRIISPIKSNELNKISYKWNKSLSGFELKINEKNINSKVTDEFINNIKSKDKFLSQFTNKEIRDGVLPVKKLGLTPSKPLIVDEKGHETNALKQSSQGQSRGMSM